MTVLLKKKEKGNAGFFCISVEWLSRGVGLNLQFFSFKARLRCGFSERKMDVQALQLHDMHSLSPPFLFVFKAIPWPQYYIQNNVFIV